MNRVLVSGIIGRGQGGTIWSSMSIINVALNCSIKRSFFLPACDKLFHYSSSFIHHVPVRSNSNNDGTMRRVYNSVRGCVEYSPKESLLRSRLLDIVTASFKRHGALPFEAPCLQYMANLLNDLSDDSRRQVFALQLATPDAAAESTSEIADVGGGALGLRYDLTLPLAIYVARNKISYLRRYHIGHVFRRDSPSLKHGRLCQFLQCDFDVVGSSSVFSDAECLAIVHDIFSQLGLGDCYRIRLNDRQLLDNILLYIGCAHDQLFAIRSALDKLDKVQANSVWRHLTNDLSISDSIVCKIADLHSLVSRCNLAATDNIKSDPPLEVSSAFNDSSSILQPMAVMLEMLMQWLRQHNSSCSDDDRLLKIKVRVNFLQLIIKLTQIMHVPAHVISFDAFLTRGLHYYTGLIFEASLTESSVHSLSSDVTHVSVAAGGRYDNLIEQFQPGWSRPCVGVSLGFDRLYQLIGSKLHSLQSKCGKPVQTQVFVAAAHHGIDEDCARLIAELWADGFAAETGSWGQWERSVKLLDQFQYCESVGIEWVVILGADELQNNSVRIRHVPSRTEKLVARTSLLSQLHESIC